MSEIKIILLILGMAVVTYIPRMLPAAFIDKMKYGKKTEKFLKLIPYTAMSALIFPGVFTVDSNNYFIGIIGGMVAAVLAFLRCPVTVCVISAIAADFVIYLVV